MTTYGSEFAPKEKQTCAICGVTHWLGPHTDEQCERWSKCMAEAKAAKADRPKNGSAEFSKAVAEIVTSKKPRARRPTHPGKVLLKDFLEPNGYTTEEFAIEAGLDVIWVKRLIAGKYGVEENSARRFAEFFGTSPQFWLNLQWRWDGRTPEKVQR